MRLDHDFPTSRVAERIIRSRGETPASQRTDDGSDQLAYVATLITEGFPQMGFSVFCKDGSRHGFLYHNLDNLELKEGSQGSYLCFTHRGKAATLRGRHLHEAFQAIMEHTLQAFYEFDANAYPSAPDSETLVDWIRIDDLNAPTKLDSSDR